MPLISTEGLGQPLGPTQIDRALRNLKNKNFEGNPKESLKDLLEESGLSPQDLLQELGFLMRSAEGENTRLAAIKVAAEMNGLLSDDTIKTIPVVNIIIHDPQFVDVNPILLTR